MSDRIRRSRPLPWVGRVFLGLVCLGVVGWMALAIYFDLAAAWPMWLRAGLAVFVPVAALVALLLVRPRWRAFAGIAAAFVVVVAAWLAIPPSNSRDWQRSPTPTSRHRSQRPQRRVPERRGRA